MDKNTKKITPNQATRRMKDILSNPDKEKAHSDADDLVIILLKQAGFNGAADVYEKADKYCG